MQLLGSASLRRCVSSYRQCIFLKNPVGSSWDHFTHGIKQSKLTALRGHQIHLPVVTSRTYSKDVCNLFRNCTSSLVLRNCRHRTLTVRRCFHSSAVRRNATKSKENGRLKEKEGTEIKGKALPRSSEVWRLLSMAKPERYRLTGKCVLF